MILTALVGCQSVIVVVEVFHICNTDFSWVDFDFTLLSDDSPSLDKMQFFGKAVPETPALFSRKCS